MPSVNTVRMQYSKYSK